jgi:hypothetical protein
MGCCAFAADTAGMETVVNNHTTVFLVEDSPAIKLRLREPASQDDRSFHRW